MTKQEYIEACIEIDERLKKIDRIEKQYENKEILGGLFVLIIVLQFIIILK